ncbi:hypothetical protein CcCBS67573_g05601 [Chytriomyces confervae]|uniref:COX assembly mitochondrial protein n=1 Tax=Chytriomyces confervae TaxID=246404 RepID=A0A507FAC5_9FUNG|nr:hypothetical protein CcCBS67573_g05601 [Chytriomyces confervae]
MFHRLKECISAGGLSGRFSLQCKELQAVFDNCLKVDFETKRLENSVRAKERAKKWKDANQDIGM